MPQSGLGLDDTYLFYIMGSALPGQMGLLHDNTSAPAGSSAHQCISNRLSPGRVCGTSTTVVPARSHDCTPGSCESCFQSIQPFCGRCSLCRSSRSRRPSGPDRTEPPVSNVVRSQHISCLICTILCARKSEMLSISVRLPA